MSADDTPTAPDADASSPFDFGPPPLAPPDRLGPYRVVRHVADGGAGSVYEAVHEVTRVRVAIKLVKAGVDTRAALQRFEAERRALARFDHLNLAKVIDAGADRATGRPWFALEFVPGGLPITDFADAERLTVRQRLDLFRQACAAVAHAHAKAVIHRDLKPGNVLAHFAADGKPAVKVIDFGLAKALSGDAALGLTAAVTEAGLPLGTYEYMSPEQADGSGDVDTRADVYALGVLLYELLAGVRPFDRADLARVADAELRRVIREVDPRPPSARVSALGPEAGARVADRRDTRPDALARALRRELEWVPLKAMRKDRARRYASVAALSADVGNYLEGRPLDAAPEGRVYRARKFARRNHAAVAAGATVAAVLLAGLAGTTWGLAREARQRAEAERQRSLAVASQAEAERRERQTAAVVEFITKDVFENALPERMSDGAAREAIVKNLIEPAAKQLARRFADDERTRAAVESVVGRFYYYVNRDAEAEALFRAALDRQQRLLGPDHPDTLYTRVAHAYLLTHGARSMEAVPIFRDAYERRARVLGPNHRATIECYAQIGMALLRVARSAEAEPILRDAAAQCRAAFGPDDPDTLITTLELADVLHMGGRSDEALPYARATLDGLRRAVDPDHPWTLSCLASLGDILYDLNRFDEAAAAFAEVAERAGRTFGPDHRMVIVALFARAHIALAQGRPAAEVDALVDEGRRRVARAPPGNAQLTFWVPTMQALILSESSRAADAEPLARRTLEAARGGPRADPFLMDFIVDAYGVVLFQAGRTEEAIAVARASLRRSVAQSGEDGLPSNRVPAWRLAAMLGHAGRAEEAAAVRRQHGVPPTFVGPRYARVDRPKVPVLVGPPPDDEVNRFVRALLADEFTTTRPTTHPAPPP